MPNIRVDTSYTIVDGSDVVFVAPCNCNEIDGLKVYSPDGAQSFTFKDAHGNALTGLGNLFSAGAYVKAILDVTNGHAYIQNADTNAYLEGRFNSKQNTLTWVTDEDIEAMFAGTYEGTEDEDADGGGGLSITDDGAGNVTITSSGSVPITDDGNGNVAIA